jgi:hypothetical protein
LPYAQNTSGTTADGILAAEADTVAALGSPADTPWPGTGAGTIIAALKALVGAERSIQGAVPLNPSDNAANNVPPGRMLAIACTAAGNITVVYPDGSTHVIPVSVGYARFPDAVVRVNQTGTTATASYANLK